MMPVMQSKLAQSQNRQTQGTRTAMQMIDLSAIAGVVVVVAVRSVCNLKALKLPLKKMRVLAMTRTTPSRMINRCRLQTLRAPQKTLDTDLLINAAKADVGAREVPNLQHPKIT
jgi:hypothetical protein